MRRFMHYLLIGFLACQSFLPLPSGSEEKARKPETESKSAPKVPVVNAESTDSPQSNKVFTEKSKAAKEPSALQPKPLNGEAASDQPKPAAWQENTSAIAAAVSAASATIAFVIAIFQLRLFRTQLCSMEAALNLSRLQLEVTQRPWLAFEVTPSRSLETRDGIINVGLDLEITNSGSVPASNVQWFLSLKSGKNPSYLASRDIKEIIEENGESKWSHLTIFPAKSQHFQLNASIPEDEAVDAISKQYELVLLIVLKYRSPLSPNNIHYTTAAYSVMTKDERGELGRFQCGKYYSKDQIALSHGANGDSFIAV